ncbi:MAG: lipid II flippase Amj family protein [Kaiparowitsia implicata GSE-PSE-MK54-09C]|nr:lipid II flippase Amj family protein [Kaiparowitsia implicata GSE-PSE-MK54-09C]
MGSQLTLILGLTFVIHLIGTLAYAFRIAGVRSGHIAIAVSLFNILVLVSRLSNSFQGPFLAKRVEVAISEGSTNTLEFEFALIIATSSIATLIGGLLIPTFQRYAIIGVASFSRHRSMPRLMLRAISYRGLLLLSQSFVLPSYKNVGAFALPARIPLSIILMNFAASALWTVGVLAAIYAGSIDPQIRVTSSTLSSIINGLATIMLFIFVDPYLAGLTDDSAKSSASAAHFRSVVIWMIAGRFAGTVAAQFLLVPAANLIAFAASLI